MLKGLFAYFASLHRRRHYVAILRTWCAQKVRFLLGPSLSMGGIPQVSGAQDDTFGKVRHLFPPSPCVERLIAGFLALFEADIQSRIVVWQIHISRLFDALSAAKDKATDAREQLSALVDGSAREDTSMRILDAQRVMDEIEQGGNLLRSQVRRAGWKALGWMALCLLTGVLETTVVAGTALMLLPDDSPLSVAQAWATAVAATAALAFLAERGLLPLLQDRSWRDRASGERFALVCVVLLSLGIALLRSEVMSSGNMTDLGVFCINLLVVPAIAFASGHCAVAALSNVNQAKAMRPLILRTATRLAAVRAGYRQLRAKEALRKSQTLTTRRALERCVRDHTQNAGRIQRELEALLTTSVRQVLTDPNINRTLVTTAADAAAVIPGDTGPGEDTSFSCLRQCSGAIVPYSTPKMTRRPRRRSGYRRQ